jgi:ABC-type bacteriocin/lantibiotic exporter with double-glycine peptidase domain
MENKTFNIIFNLLTKLNINVSKHSLHDSLSSQPHKNSLDAIRKILIDFNINSKSYNEITLELLKELPLPLIAQIKDKRFIWRMRSFVM